MALLGGAFLAGPGRSAPSVTFEQPLPERLPRRAVLHAPVRVQPPEQRRRDRLPGAARKVAQPHVHRQPRGRLGDDAGHAARWEHDLRVGLRLVGLLGAHPLLLRRGDLPARQHRLLRQAHVRRRSRAVSGRAEDGRGERERALRASRRESSRGAGGRRREATLRRPPRVRPRDELLQLQVNFPTCWNGEDARQRRPQAAHGATRRRDAARDASRQRCRRSR